MGKVALGQVRLPLFRFPLSLWFHQSSTFIFIYMLLLPRQTGEVWKPSKNALSEVGEHWIEKDFHWISSGCVVAQAAGRWPRSQVSPYKICGGQSGTEADFSSTTSVYPRQYHFTCALYSSSSTCCCYQKDKKTKPGKQQAMLFRQSASTG